MTKTFTQDDVVRYLYNEIPQNEKASFEEQLICNTTLLDMFHELRAVKNQLEQIEETPSDDVINNILEYSRNINNLHSVKK